MVMADFRPLMSDPGNADTCSFCGEERVLTRMEWLEFRQWTDRGYVFCKVLIPVGTCDGCGSKTWSEAAETVIEVAVKQEYDKLS